MRVGLDQAGQHGEIGQDRVRGRLPLAEHIPRRLRAVAPDKADRSAS
jgi:hypothetical protein